MSSSSSSSSSSSDPPQSPWQTPPPLLADLLLPLLPLPDLARFSSVCSQWRSLALTFQDQDQDQDQHNLSPLPLLLVSSHPHHLDSPSLFSPFEHPPRFYPHHPLLPFLSSLTPLHSSRSHLLLLSSTPPTTLSLLNLLTSHLLPLPSPPSPTTHLFFILSTPRPHSLLLATAHSSLLFLLHPFLQNHQWIPLPYPHHSSDPVESAVYFDNKFYCKCRSMKRFVVVDPTAPAIRVLEMQNSLDLDFARGHGIESLVVCGGDVFLVKGIGNWWFDSIEFWLYRVDFEERVFEKKVEGIGDSIMFLDHCGSVSLRVGDGVGRGNRVYYGFNRCSTELMRAVDLETGYEDDVPEEAVEQYDPPLFSHCWLVPR